MRFGNDMITFEEAVAYLTEQVIAWAVAFERKGHFFTRRAPGYRVYCALWPRLRWCRQAIFHLRAVLPGNGRKGQK